MVGSLKHILLAAYVTSPLSIFIAMNVENIVVNLITNVTVIAVAYISYLKVKNGTRRDKPYEKRSRTDDADRDPEDGQDPDT